ncbi:hypothetical protein HK096_010828 [Nowakowskiella sp. JEL0078]|nr:hypothetical protein HK096_010828 [Nowakowskiella sp. JEL0078]
MVLFNIEEVSEEATERSLIRNGSSENNDRFLNRKLDARHLQLIAIGGTIGWHPRTGMFLGSGATIAEAGPAGSLLAFFIVSIMVYLVTTSLGEMATYIPVPGSFSTYGTRFVHPSYGFALGWNYWLQWAISLPSEISAAGIIMSYWYPNVESWIWSVLILGILLVINIFGVRGFGEAEYWLSMIKVVAVISFIIVGLLYDIGAIPVQKALWFDYWFIQGAPFKNGFVGVFNVFVIAFFSFGGTELIGITAAETKDPAKNVPRAVNQTFWRLLLFYIMTIFVIGLCIRNDDPNLLDAVNNNNVAIAPFTLLFEKAGLKYAANLLNGVIMSAVISAGNSSMYAASRTLMALAHNGQAPEFLGAINYSGIPLWSLLATSAVGYGSVFTFLLNITGISGILTWISISLIHIRFRRAFIVQNRNVREELIYLAPCGISGDILAILLGLAVLVGEIYAAYFSAFQSGDSGSGWKEISDNLTK